MVETSATLFLLAAVCLVAAIVGGNLGLPGGVKFPQLSTSTRAVLFAASIMFVCAGIALLVLFGPAKPSPTEPGPGQASSPTVNPAPGQTSLPPAPPDCRAPSITADPGSGSPGDVVKVSGLGFLPDSIVTLSMYGDSGALGLARTDKHGAFSSEMEVTRHWSREYLPMAVAIYAQAGGCMAQTDFLLTP